MNLNDCLKIESLKSYSEDESLLILGILIDSSYDIADDKGPRKAINLCHDINLHKHFKNQVSLAHYFLANAWADLRRLDHKSPESWEWDHEQLVEEIIHLRNAIKYFDPAYLDNPTARLCQIHTNLANSLDFSGRFIAAIENWNTALEVNKDFGMALGAKGNAIIYHGLNSIYDDGHKFIYIGLGYQYLKKAISFSIEPHALADYKLKVQHLESSYKWVIDYNPDLHKSSEVYSDEEKSYRDWCLTNTLFLNPLNDLGEYKIANHDPFALPTMLVSSKKAGSFHSFFNQIKQEYIASRLFLYKGIQEGKEIHYADRGVLKYDNLDFSIHSINIEFIKSAYRIAYSVFDKISYFLNKYLELGVPERAVNFRTIWYDKRGQLKDEFIRKQNLMFRALYWVSKDLFYNDSSYKVALEPDASELVKIRNHIEHKGFRVFEETLFSEVTPPPLMDKISYSISKEGFYARTLKVIKIAREAIIYLSLGIRWEERIKDQTDKYPTITPLIK